MTGFLVSVYIDQQFAASFESGFSKIDATEAISTGDSVQVSFNY